MAAMLAIVLGIASLPDGRSPQAAGPLWVTGYYASYTVWSADMPTSEVDFSALTHVIHWPIVPKNDGTFVDPDTYGLSAAQSQEVVQRAHAVGTRALLGFGGDVGAVGDGWHGATLDQNRAAFITRMVALMQQRGYDGIDINWEGMDPADEGRFVTFIQQLRAALDTITPRPLLTWVPGTGYLPPIAVTAATQNYFDQINLQTYVMSGPYPGWVTWFNSPLYNGGAVFPSTGGPLPAADVEVDRYVAAGIPVGKLGLGIQFDGFVWKGGAGTPTGGVAAPRQDFADDQPAPALDVFRYADVLTQFGSAPGCVKTFDAIARVPWIGCDRAANADDRFISFDDEQAIQEKATYIRDKGMGGVFVFELSGDYQPAAGGIARHPLVNALKAAFAPPALPVSPPANLRATVAGNTLTLEWDAPASGTPPTSYVVEGGLAPGQVAASIGTNSASPTFTVTAPSGAWYVRVHALAGSSKSAASNEIRVFVNVPAPPPAPANLLGLADGSRLVLSWTNPGGGGAPAGVTLHVSGSIVTSLVLPAGETFAYSGVPPGTYTFSVSAFNGSGASASSNSVTLTFPGTCAGAPQPPLNFVATKAGSVITVAWSPPVSGPALTRYTVNVTGGFTGNFETTSRSMSGAVGPGSYSISVTASNTCGTSAPTLPHTVTVP